MIVPVDGRVCHTLLITPLCCVGYLLALCVLLLGGVGFADAPKKESPDAPQVVKLLARAERIAVGGSGRVILLHLPKVKLIAVFDVKEGKVVKHLPAPDDKSLIAAGRDHLFIVSSEARTMQRWNLTTLEKEATVRLPGDGPVGSIHVGSASLGPMLVTSPYSQLQRQILIDPIKIRTVTTPPLSAGTFPEYRVSSDGRTFTWQTTTGQSPGTVAVLRVADGKASVKTLQTVGRSLQPGNRGQSFYTFQGIYDDQLQRVHPSKSFTHTNYAFPAADGNLFLEVEPPPAPAKPYEKPQFGPKRAHVYFEGVFDSFATLEDLNKAGESSTSLVHLAPRYGKLVTLSLTHDAIIVHPFDLAGLLAKSNSEYLGVSSEPPQSVIAGERFEYAPVVHSKKGGVKLKLTAAPEGMKLTPENQLIWEVPATTAKQEVVVVLTVSDASGREFTHTFTLSIAERLKNNPPE